MSEKISIENLTGVMETLLPVLYSRVHESQQDNPIIQDPVAIEWVSRIEYDFSRFEDSILNNLAVAIRTEILDDYCREFIGKYPDATVINIAAGLDTRFYRMDNGQVTWIELDLPESMAVRRQLMEETEHHKTIASSALDTGWMDELKTESPVLFIVEGLLMYLTEAQIKGMLSAIAERFPKAEFLLEVIGVTLAKNTHLNDAISRTDAQFNFGIRDVSQMGEWHPDLSLVDYVSIYDRHVERWLVLDIDWKGKNPIDYRDSTGRIVRLRMTD